MKYLLTVILHRRCPNIIVHLMLMVDDGVPLLPVLPQATKQIPSDAVFSQSCLFTFCTSILISR